MGFLPSKYLYSVESGLSGDGHADLTYVMAAAQEVAKLAKEYIVIVTKSTVPVGTNRQVKQAVRKANPDLDFDVASNPEFLREGAAIEDFMKPDRVVVGVQSQRAAEVMQMSQQGDVAQAMQILTQR